MKSWLLDASMELVHSHDENDIRIYTVILKFRDLFGNARQHFDTVALPISQVVQTRVSFTAMSSVGAKPGLVERVTDLEVRILFADRTIDIPNRHMFPTRAGQLVHVIEHLDVVSGDGRLHDIAIPYNLPFSPEALCLQTVNADVMDDAGNLLYRLSADSLPGGHYGAHMAT